MRTKLAPTSAGSSSSGCDVGTCMSGVKLLPDGDILSRPCDLAEVLCKSCFGRFNEMLALRSRMRDALIDTLCQ